MSESATLRRTVRHLADGREIIYFDDTRGAPPRTTDDARALPERAAAGHLRFDALVGDWVAVAGHRMNRTLLPPRDECPLCPTGRGSIATEIPDPDYDVVVIENRFPSYAPVAFDGGERGRTWKGRSISHSAYTSAALHPGATALLATAVGLTVAGFALHATRPRPTLLTQLWRRATRG